MIGLRVNDKPLHRVYSIVSANYEDHLEFLDLKVAEGPPTSRLETHPFQAKRHASNIRSNSAGSAGSRKGDKTSMQGTPRSNGIAGRAAGCPQDSGD